MFAPNDQLTSLEGTISIVYAGSFFHLFSYAQQLYIAKLIVRLLKPVPGSMLLGRQVGTATPTEVSRPGSSVYLHDQHSWKEMWEKVGAETGTKWDVQAELDETGFEQERKQYEQVRRIHFVIKRL